MDNVVDYPDGTIFYIIDGFAIISGVKMMTKLTQLKYVGNESKYNTINSSKLIAGYRVAKYLQEWPVPTTCFLDHETARDSLNLSKYNKLINKKESLDKELEKIENDLKLLIPEYQKIREKYAEDFI